MSDNWNFYRSRNGAVGILEGMMKRHPDHAEFWEVQVKLLRHLKSYPNDSKVIRNLDPSAKAKLLKAHLEDAFPNVKFEIKTKRWTKPTIIVRITGMIPTGVEEIVNIYQDKGQTDLDFDNLVTIQVEQ